MVFLDCTEDFGADFNSYPIPHLMESSSNKIMIFGLLACLVLFCLVPMIFRSKSPPKEEVTRIQTMAEKGDSYSQIQLGHMYEKGIGVRKDLIEAYKWLTLA